MLGLNFLSGCLYKLTIKSRHLMIFSSETIDIFIKQCNHFPFWTSCMFLFTNVSLVTVPSHISTSSNGLADEKPCPSFSTSSKSSIVSQISFFWTDIVPQAVVANLNYFVYPFITLHCSAEIKKLVV